MNGFICGNCKSGMIYQDYIPGLPGGHGWACMKCGNREPNGVFVEKDKRGKEPKKEEMPMTGELCRQIDAVADKYPDLPKGGDDNDQHTGDVQTAPEPKEGDRDKNGRLLRRCRICGLVKVNHGDGLCSQCWWEHVKKPAKAAARKEKEQIKAAAAKNSQAAKATAREEIQQLKAVPACCPETPKKAEQPPMVGQDEKFVQVSISSARELPPMRPPEDAKGATYISVPLVSAEARPGAAQDLDVKPRVAIVLGFYDSQDLDLLDFIDGEARRCRRTPDQQILWMLQSHMPESRAAIFYKATGDQNEHKSHDITPGPL